MNTPPLKILSQKNFRRLTSPINLAKPVLFFSPVPSCFAKWFPDHPSQFKTYDRSFTTGADTCFIGSATNGKKNSIWHISATWENIESMQGNGTGRQRLDEAIETLKAGNNKLSSIIVGGQPNMSRCQKLLTAFLQAFKDHGIEHTIVLAPQQAEGSSDLAFRTINNQPTWYLAARRMGTELRAKTPLTQFYTQVQP